MAVVTTPVALTVAGSDPSGGAGIQADLKVFAAFRVYGAAVPSVLTVQNTQRVARVLDLPADFVAAQLAAVLDDLPVSSMKTGMLGAPAVVEALGAVLADHSGRDALGRERSPALVVDPVMVATSGDVLMSSSSISTVCHVLIPRAALVTPNLDEAAALTGRAVVDPATMRDAARAIADMGARAVLVKGGHLRDAAIDVLFDGRDFHEFAARRLAGGARHGTGCALSAAITALLAHGESLLDAVAKAKRFVHAAIATAPALGRGAVPVNHLVEWENE
jgi:hydroxymethylpyrimidine/phosphomethylpyrimidine kinase